MQGESRKSRDTTCSILQVGASLCIYLFLRLLRCPLLFSRECFTPLVTLKFRRSLEPHVNANTGTSKRPKLKASGSLVLGFSGGLGSSILLDIVHRTYFANEFFVDGEPRGGTNHPRNANVWTSCTVCYVEVCNAFPEVRKLTIPTFQRL